MARRSVFFGFECNNRCHFCAQGDRREGRERVDVVEAERIIEGAVPGDVVAFVGGEPTLAAELPDLLRCATARPGVRTLLQTNGRRLAYPAYAVALAEAAKSLALDVSLHGSSAAMHDYHTATPGSFAQTARGIQNARARGLSVGVTVVVTRSNDRHLAEIVRLVRALGADALHLAPLSPVGSARTSLLRLQPNEELARARIDTAVSEGARRGVRVIVGDPEAAGLEGRFAGLGVTA